MGKSKAKRKLQALQNGPAAKKSKHQSILTPPSDNSPFSSLSLRDLVATDDIETTVDVLSTLTENPSFIKSKGCKELRTAVYEFRLACTTGLNASVDSNLTARISGALADRSYTQARILLAEMRIRGEVPKLGALCRWVRDLDAVSGLAEQISGTSPSRTSAEEDVHYALDAVLRVTGPIDYSPAESTKAGRIVLRDEWDLRDNSRPRRRVYQSVLDHSIFDNVNHDIKSRFRIIETTPGVQRKPPNLHPAVLYASKDDSINLTSSLPDTSCHNHPMVPNLRLLENVLSADQCEQIICAAESIGFTPDAPIREEGDESSVLAHNFYWIVDTSFCAKLWARVAPFVPEKVEGKQVRGLNRRFRVYRYVPGAEYRAHIDGAWPPSSIDLETDKYIYDSSPTGAKQSSLFTFLIYLNDEFEAGETTFFLPSAREGTMNAYPVKPIQGSVAMFPHGETGGSLLHEGTGVRNDGRPTAKYVIRTDVLYDVEAQK